LAGGDLDRVLAGSIDIHFHPIGAAIEGAVGKGSRRNGRGHSAGVLHPIKGARVGSAVIEKLDAVTVAGGRIITKNQTTKGASIRGLAHGNLKGSRRAVHLVVNQKVVDRSVAAAGLE